MEDPNITMEEYIKLEEEKARRHGRTFNWKTATYGKIEYCKDEDDSFTNLETEYRAIVFDDTSDVTLSCEPMASPLDNNEIDFKISFDESNDEDYMVATAGALRAAEDALAADEGAQAVLAPGQTPKKVTGVDLFYLRSMDQRTANVIELPLIDLHKLRKHNICLRVGDTWAWVAPGPERQQVATAGALRAAEDALAADEGAQAVPAPAFDSTLVSSSRVSYQRHSIRRIEPLWIRRIDVSGRYRSQLHWRLAAAVASPTGVLELDTYSSSKADPLKSSLPLVSVAPMVLLFLCSDDSESDIEIPERHISPTTSTPKILTAPILLAPSAIVAPSSEFPPALVVAPLGIRRR
nr:hypothetical protein [Tanacetum cinerariifolium]